MRGGGVFPAHAAACADGYEGTRVFWELVASFHECQHCSLWPQCKPRVVAGRDAVRKTHGTPRQRGGWHAHDHYILALVGFQGRGWADVVQPTCCHPFFLEALLFQWPSIRRCASRTMVEHKPPASKKSVASNENVRQHPPARTRESRDNVAPHCTAFEL